MRTIIFLWVLCLFACQNSSSDTQHSLHIIPKPHTVELAKGNYAIGQQSSFQYSPELENEANYLRAATGFPIHAGDEKADIQLILDETYNSDSSEGYSLSVNAEGVQIKAADKKGVFYGIQSFMQLLPPEVFKTKQLSTTVDLSFLSIEDKPRFSYRGMHLDVCRHFFPPSDIKKYIDLLALHKMNTFHWHLTEDQGWRIEIKKYPKLQEIAAFRKETLVGHYNDQPQQYDGKRYGGFYSQEEIREIVQYAQERHITIIPEIEMPGHAQAALAAYPEFACTSGPFDVLTKWGVSNEVYCPKEETFTFLENVLLEVMELFPSEYIHIGGDECPKLRWKESAFCQNLIKEKNLKDEQGLQSYFIGRIEKFLNAHGRNIIGWDEILEGGLAPNATVMSWRGVAGGLEAAKQKHKVIMTPNSHCYLDYYQSDHADEPLAIGGFLPLKKVYSYEPIDAELTAEQAKYILGVQGNVWTEYIPDFKKVEYMAFPRASAIAEVGWSVKEKDYADFLLRLEQHRKRLAAMDVNFADHSSDVIATSFQDNGLKIALTNETSSNQIRYTLDGTQPSANSEIYTAPIKIKESVELVAKSFDAGKVKGREARMDVQYNKATGKQIQLTHAPAERYSQGGIASILNGITGSDERYGDMEWLGFSGKDFEAIIDLGQSTEINEIKMRFFKAEGQWIYLPTALRVSLSDHNRDYIEIMDARVLDTDKKVKINTIRFSSPKYGRYLKIEVPNYGIIPEGKQGGGHPAWLFVDEIIIN